MRTHIFKIKHVAVIIFVKACDIVSPFTYQPEAAEEAGLIRRQIKEDKIKAMRDFVLPPIDSRFTVPEDKPLACSTLKFPSLEKIMEMVEDYTSEGYRSGYRLYTVDVFADLLIYQCGIRLSGLSIA